MTMRTWTTSTIRHCLRRRSAVVKNTHELVCTQLVFRLCAYNHLVKAEVAEVKNDVCDAYVKYGMNVFEHDHTEKLRMREEETHGDYGFSDDEAEEVTLVVDEVEDDLEGAR
jgi:hypothetical protein